MFDNLVIIICNDIDFNNNKKLSIDVFSFT